MRIEVFNSKFKVDGWMDGKKIKLRAHLTWGTSCTTNTTQLATWLVFL